MAHCPKMAIDNPLANQSIRMNTLEFKDKHLLILILCEPLAVHHYFCAP